EDHAPPMAQDATRLLRRKAAESARSGGLRSLLRCCEDDCTTKSTPPGRPCQAIWRGGSHTLVPEPGLPDFARLGCRQSRLLRARGLPVFWAKTPEPWRAVKCRISAGPEEPSVRILLHTGKGGVGKTTISAATALAAAGHGHRTLVVSTDAAHSLSDSLETSIGHDVRRIGPNLWAQEIDALYQLEKYWGVLRRYVASVMRAHGLDDIVAAELANLPGMEEIASLMQLTALAREGRFDVIIVDCAPTGETMQLLSFPEIARWWLEKLFPIQRAVVRVARPVVQRFIEIPLPTDEVFAAVKDLILNVDEMHGLLADPTVTSMRIVLNLEKMVIKE